MTAGVQLIDVVVIDARGMHAGDIGTVVAATERLTGLPVVVMFDPRHPVPRGHLFPTGSQLPGNKLWRKSNRGRRMRGH